ncbi:UDP-N-acetylmuramoyl-tripeptide--D-alanyl-D-alanine ligase [Marinobacter sp. C2H3]|uniref:UDP-N-acetylmuramoyl-tripeptide--D-alanyl-D- alanine ligase n=1 Tax=Marinobacter sp. C2H3 TaxID=3119003 RepID=UPI00300F6CE2
MMRAFSLAEACQWASARCDQDSLDDRQFTGVSTDSRSVRPGDLFVALRGDRFDGHRFLKGVEAAGAAAAVVDEAQPGVSLPQLVVDDTVDALARLAAGHRRQSGARLMAVTGSSGKTTVREMAAAILSEMGPTLATEGNLNNHIGVPLTLFRLAPEHRFGAIELGASGVGEIAHTVAITRPEVVMLTNAGQAHLERFGSYENIVEAKGEIIEGVMDGGVVVLNRDDPAFDIWRQRAGERRVVSISQQGRKDADYRLLRAVDDHGQQRLTVAGPDGWQLELSLPLPGVHNQANALMVIAASRALGATDAQLQAGFARMQPVKGRLNRMVLSEHLTVIDDSYNANPASIKAALAVLSGEPGQTVAVLGAMAELGPRARDYHREVGACARELGIQRLLAVGAGAEGYADGFGPQTEIMTDHQAAVDAVLATPGADMTVLVKGSRSSAMDRVVEGIQKKVTNACCSG